MKRFLIYIYNFIKTFGRDKKNIPTKLPTSNVSTVDTTSDVSTFDIGIVIDDTYAKLKQLGHPIKVHVQLGTVTFIIVDEIFITYVDLVYNTTYVKEYVVNVFYKIKHPAPDYTELVITRKVKTLDEVLNLLNTDNYIKLIPNTSNE